MKKFLNNLGLVVLASLVLYILGLTIGDLDNQEPMNSENRPNIASMDTKDHKAHHRESWEQMFGEHLEKHGGTRSRKGFTFETPEELDVYIKQGFLDRHKLCMEDKHMPYYPDTEDEREPIHRILPVEPDIDDLENDPIYRVLPVEPGSEDEVRDIDSEPIYRILPIEPEYEKE